MQVLLTLISIVISFLLGCQCSYHAKKKGRNANMWFMAGVLFGLLALLTILLLPARKPTQMITIAPASETPFQAFQLLQSEKFWYFLSLDKKQHGPMSFAALKTEWQKGTIQEKTYVWNEELENWKPLKEVVKL